MKVPCLTRWEDSTVRNDFGPRRRLERPRRAAASFLSGEATPSLGATGVDDSSSALCTHADEKAMSALSTYF